jgi:glycosyltransferase involved in cell wall biosynthesis
MKILIVHNRYQQQGGEDTVVAAEEWLLRSNGHQVELFQADNDHIQGALSAGLVAVQSIYSFSGKRRMHEALRKFQPDLVHVHNFFPTLSPSIFVACSEAEVPVVHTLHNYRIQCAVNSLYRAGQVCEECVLSQSFLPGIRHACYRSSRIGSAVVGFTMALHDQIGTWSSRISAYIALTKFAAEKLARFRIPPDKLFVKPNFTIDRGAGSGEGNYALFAGRLTLEKGIQTIIDADLAGALCMDVVVLGDGPMRPALEQAAGRIGSRLKVKGFIRKDEMSAWMKDAKALLMTSLWYEPGDPLVMIEAFCAGLPVVASNIGHAAATVRAEGVGMLYAPGDHIELAASLQKLADHPDNTNLMRQNARNYYLATHSPEKNYERLMEIYAQAMRITEGTGLKEVNDPIVANRLA